MMRLRKTNKEFFVRGNKSEWSMISCRPVTKIRLLKFAKKIETYDSTLNRLLDVAEKRYQKPRGNMALMSIKYGKRLKNESNKKGNQRMEKT
jgi:hypothetical protein